MHGNNSRYDSLKVTFYHFDPERLERKIKLFRLWDFFFAERTKKNNKMNKRVVITGLGVVAPNGVGLDAFTHAIKNGISGIKHDTELERLQFSCQIAGKPEISAELAL